MDTTNIVINEHKKALPIRIVIPAYHSGEELVRNIRAITNTQFDLIPIDLVLEIVVVDNGGNPGLSDRLRPFDTTVMHDETKHSAAYARTAGAEGFEEGIIIFLDDDVTCEPTALARLIKPILNGDAVASVGNYSSNVQGLTFPQAYKQLYVHHIYSRGSGELPNEYWTAIGAIRADVFHKLGGFDTSFVGACGEDMDLGIRLTRAGYRIWAVPDACAQHHHEFTTTGIIRNDYRKAMIAMFNLTTQGVPISEHRHSSPRDIFAVLSSVMMILGMLSGGLGSDSSMLILLATLCWIGCRYDLMRLFFRSAGAGFCIRSLALMNVLDLVRAWCAMLGIFKWKVFKRPARVNAMQNFELSINSDPQQ